MASGIQHQNATDPYIHEPKGASTAAVGTVYVATGTGTGDWFKPPFFMTMSIEDASIAGPTSYFLIVPWAAALVKVSAVVNKTFSADQTIEIDIGGVPVTGGIVTLTASGSGAGDIFSTIPSADNLVSGGAAIEIINTGGSASPFIVSLTLTFEPTA